MNDFFRVLSIVSHKLTCRIMNYAKFFSKLGVAIMLVIVYSQSLWATTLCESMALIEDTQGILNINNVSDFAARSDDETNNHIFEQLFAVSDGNIYAPGLFNEGGLSGTMIGASTAYDGRWYDGTGFDREQGNIIGATGTSGGHTQGSSLENLHLDDEVNIDRAAGDNDDWMLTLRNGYANKGEMDIYANDLSPDNDVLGSQPDNIVNLNGALPFGWEMLEQQIYMIALYIPEVVLGLNIQDASMRKTEADAAADTNNGTVKEYNENGNYWSQRFAAGYEADIAGGSWVLLIEDKINVDKSNGSGDTYWRESDFDYNDWVIVLDGDGASTVPEPSSVILFIVGLSLLCLKRSGFRLKLSNGGKE